MSRTKACESAMARFVFKPACGIYTEKRLDTVANNVRETIAEIEKYARFYRFSPCFSRKDGSIEVIIYREGYIKKHPNRFGLKRQQLKDLSGPLPDEFADIMSALHGALSCLSRLNSFTTFELISYTNDGGEIVIGPKKIKNKLADDFRMEDFGEIEEYEVDPRYFEEWVNEYLPEEEFGDKYDDENS